MRKIIIAIFMFILPLTAAKAIEGVNIGISVMGGVFEANGAKEKFTGAHSSGASPGDVTKNTSSEGDVAEGEFVLPSLFIEKTLGEKFAVGFDYVPMSAESETTENTQTSTDGSTTGTNTVQVDFENLMTLYGTFSFTDSLYAKIGYSEVDVKTNENLATGGAYGDTTLNGFILGLGYNANLDNQMFIRVEANYMDFDGATLTNTADSTKSVSADGFDGYGARISVGKSF
jgi:hypothetical protein